MKPTVPLACSLALLVLSPLAAAQVRTLSGPLAREAVGAFSTRLGSASTARLAYGVDELGDFTTALRSVPLSGTEAPRELWPRPASLMGLTHDGKQALFVADLDGDGLQELAVAPLDGSAAARSLAETVDAAQFFELVQASADLEHVLFLRSVLIPTPPNEPFLFHRELYSVSLLGAPAPVLLSGVLVGGGSVEGAALSRDGGQVVFQADQDLDGVLELFVVPIDGSVPALELPIPLVPGGNTVAFSFDADGTHVLYTADQAEDERFELFSIPSDGSGPSSQRSGPLVSGGDVGERTGGLFGNELFASFHVSPDGLWVLYMADAEVDERFELFRVAADGSLPALKLSLPLQQQITLSAISYDSAWAVYTAGSNGTTDVFSAPLDGSAPSRRLSGPMVAGGDAFLPQVSLDSRFVVYGADQGFDERRELFGAPIDGSSAPLRLNAPFQPSGDLETSLGNLLPGYWMMADGVMYEADQEQDELVELYFAPFPLGTPARKLAAGPVRDSFPATDYAAVPPIDLGTVTFQRRGSLLSVRVEPGAKEIELDALEHTAVVGDVAQFALAPDGTRAQYVAREEDDLVRALYSVSTGERRDAVQLHPEGALVDNALFSPDGRWAVYELGEEAPILFSAPGDGTGAPRQLYPDRAFDAVFTPDGERLVFRSDPGQREIFVVPLDGSAPALMLSDTIPAAPAVVGRPAVSADSRWVAFRTSESKLYVAPLDDSSPAVQVSADGQLVIEDVQLTADGARVFYRTDATGARKSELFVAPRDGSLAPLRLNGPIAGGGDVLAFDVTPDGARAVYLGEPQVADRQELLTVATDGSAPAVRLHAPLGASADVLDFELAPDGTRVVYRADSAVDERFELFGVPADASQAPVRIGQSPVTGGGDVLDFRIASDSSCVVFRAFGAAAGTIDLFRATLRGGRSQRRIGQAPFAGGSVRSFQLSADASTVAFAATRNAAGRQTLLAVPIGGEQKAVELAGPFAGDGSVLEYALSADGSLAAWRADQNQTGAIELFAAGVPSAPLHRQR
jgi:Tol biopolymer transport system component